MCAAFAALSYSNAPASGSVAAFQAELHLASRGADEDVWGNEAAEDDGAGGAGGPKRRRNAGDDIGAAAGRMSPEQVAQAHEALQARLARPEMVSMAATRAALPIAQFRQDILAATASRQVVIIAGETGCGKTTQVPQYLLEEAWRSGKPARIVCTQPRRISAVTVAERVAAERGERCGEAAGAVGYSIRLESRAHSKTALLFCTNGVLLRKLTQAEGDGGGLDGVTHVVVDEIHERDLFADFLVIVLRDLLPRRPDLRLVLMSATLNEELFSGYFNGAPIIRVPGA